MGGQPEKLLSIEESARRLGKSVQEVQNLIRQGRLEVFRLGGNMVRLRLRDVEALGGRLQPPPKPAVRGSGDRWLDFLYFNDFYIIGILLILTLLAVIYAL
ncbi:MAG: helix-turn-helix domain-containing protein [Candidatus Omnitrophica bacterium]|nr:helix-turn-helix domain-containing protein [Candidatus Omnitrophota bacterium]